MLTIFGDSLSAGNIGIGFPALLQELYEVPLHDRGVDGDTMYGVTNRAIRFLSSGKQTNGLLIECGSNDLLLPYLAASADSLRSQGARELIRTTRPPLSDPGEFSSAFREQLENILEYFPGSSSQIAVTTIPPLGEILDTPLQKERREINRLIQGLTEELSLTRIDLAATLEDLLSRSSKKEDTSYFLDDLSNLQKDAQFIRGSRERAWKLSQQRGLSLTIDGVHFNGVGALSAAEACLPFIKALGIPIQ